MRSRTLRTYCSAPALLALALVLASAEPLLPHLCMGGAAVSGHPCCAGDCPAASAEEVPAGEACCMSAPVPPGKSAAVAPVAPNMGEPLLALAAIAAADVVEAPPICPTLADTGPPPHVRTHLAFSILLI